MDRRKLLRRISLAGSVGVASLAGCSELTYCDSFRLQYVSSSDVSVTASGTLESVVTMENMATDPASLTLVSRVEFGDGMLHVRRTAVEIAGEATATETFAHEIDLPASAASGDATDSADSTASTAPPAASIPATDRSYEYSARFAENDHCRETSVDPRQRPDEA